MQMATPDTNTGSRTVRNLYTLSALDWIALTLLIIGGLNWGLVGAFNFDLVAFLFGPLLT
jgi:hypothetical protein